MNRNALIQRYSFPVSSADSRPILRGINGLGQYARMWCQCDNNVALASFRIDGSIDSSTLLGLPSINDPQWDAPTPLFNNSPGVAFNIDIRGQSELAINTDLVPANSIVNLTTAFLPKQGVSRVRGRILSQQTIVPSNLSTPFFGTSQIVDCADTDVLHIQATALNSVSTTWFIQGSIDGEFWWSVPDLDSTAFFNSATIYSIASGTFVRNLDVSGYRYVRLLLNGTTASPFNTLATFYGEALE